MNESSAYILALLRIQGVGRVAAGRLAASFPNVDTLLACPREQVLLRLKGIPGKGRIAAYIEEALPKQLPEARAALEALAQKNVHVSTMLDSDWPAGIADVPRSHRPVMLYLFGKRITLSKPWVAFVAAPPLSDTSFELAQKTIRMLADAGVVPATGAASGFDVVAHKLCNDADPPRPAAMVVPSGLGKLPRELRPVATATVRTGGILVSAFPMEHGPFAHDTDESAFVQTALSRAIVCVDQDRTAMPALRWALDAGRPVFSIGTTPDDTRIHRLTSDLDLEWLMVAATSPEAAS